ncbi:MAG: hypothetical protein C4K49_12410 [Candidatus Thorarchaeota archaeon]|nr:MAG: hypothetical protein C4K49_12410 [Candidatus Thorarchaeota archaeon]
MQAFGASSIKRSRTRRGRLQLHGMVAVSSRVMPNLPLGVLDFLFLRSPSEPKHRQHWVLITVCSLLERLADWEKTWESSTQPLAYLDCPVPANELTSGTRKALLGMCRTRRQIRATTYMLTFVMTETTDSRFSKTEGIPEENRMSGGQE